MFNILEHADWSQGVEDRRVLDLFAGSGALGFEAMSRGADFALFVETDAEARGVLRENIETLQLFGSTRIHRRSATDLGNKPAGLGAPFDLIFLDPPYHQGLIDKTLPRLMPGGWIAQDAIAVAECADDETPQHPGFALLDTRDYGAARLLFLRAEPSAA